MLRALAAPLVGFLALIAAAPLITASDAYGSAARTATRSVSRTVAESATKTATKVSQAVPTSNVSVSAAVVRAIPTSFLGLSMNVEEMQDFTGQPTFDQFIRLITPDGDGPFVLRVGGTYADTAYWNGEQAQVMPQYLGPAGDDFSLNQGFLNSLAAVLTATGSDAILNVNAAAHDPQMALDYLEAAEKTLPYGSLIDAAIGNEPNLYSQGYDGITKSTASWVKNFNAVRYDTLFELYANLLTRHLPGLSVAGPELGSPTAAWELSLLQHDPSQVALATEHYYAYNACAAAGSSAYPELHKYFRITNINQSSEQIAQSASLASSFGIPYRLTELGSSTCLGLPEVNNTFATSLWGLDQLLTLVTDGVDGVNFHLRADEPNTAIEATPTGLLAQPLLYGIAAFSSMIGPNATLDQVNGTLPSNVGVWAIHSSSGWGVALINDTGERERVRVAMPTSVPMTVKALTAPSPWSDSATFGGQTISDAGTWQGAARVSTAVPVTGSYWFTIPPDSAEIASTS
jgi:hypothetical protein